MSLYGPTWRLVNAHIDDDTSPGDNPVPCPRFGGIVFEVLMHDGANRWDGRVVATRPGLASPIELAGHEYNNVREDLTGLVIGLGGLYETVELVIDNINGGGHLSVRAVRVSQPQAMGVPSSIEGVD